MAKITQQDVDLYRQSGQAAPELLPLFQQYDAMYQATQAPKQSAMGGLLSAKPEDAGGFWSTLGEGVDKTVRAVGGAGNVFAGDGAALAEKAKANAEPSTNPFLRQFYDSIAVDQAAIEAGDEGFFDILGRYGKTAYSNPKGAASAVLEMVPMSAAAVGSAWAGAKAGGAAGGLVGGPVGATVGAAAGGLTGFFLGNSAMEIGANGIELGADGVLTADERGQAISEGLVKGAVVTGVDVATLGASKFILGAAGRAVEQATLRTLADKGVDVTNEAAVAAARQSAEIVDAVKAAHKTAIETTNRLAPKMARGAAALGLETTGEGLGEYLGELAATGEASLADAVLESFLGLGQSVMEMGWSASRNSAELAKKTLFERMDTARSEAANQGADALAQELAATEATAKSAATAMKALPAPAPAADQSIVVDGQGTAMTPGDAGRITLRPGMSFSVDELTQRIDEWDTQSRNMRATRDPLRERQAAELDSLATDGRAALLGYGDFQRGPDKATGLLGLLKGRGYTPTSRDSNTQAPAAESERTVLDEAVRDLKASTSRESYLDSARRIGESVSAGDVIYDRETDVGLVVEKGVTKNGTEFVSFNYADSGKQSFAFERKPGQEWRTLGDAYMPAQLEIRAAQASQPQAADSSWMSGQGSGQPTGLYRAKETVRLQGEARADAGNEALATYRQDQIVQGEAPQYALPAGLELADKEGAGRFLRDDYRNSVDGMVSQLVEGGDVGYVRDENDRITGRTASVNPQWWQNMDGLAKPGSIAEAKRIVGKALAGEKLGPKQARFISTMLDLADEQRGLTQRNEQAAIQREQLQPEFDASTAANRAEYKSGGRQYEVSDEDQSALYDYLMGRTEPFRLDELTPADIDSILRDVITLDDTTEATLEAGRNDDEGDTNGNYSRAIQAGSQVPAQQGLSSGGRSAAQGGRTDTTDGRPAEGSTESLTEPAADDILQSYSEADLQARDEQQTQANQAENETRKAETDKAQADRDRNDFTLTGSDRPTDVATARGQNDMFAAPTRGERKAGAATTSAARAKAGGELGVNGEFYPGGAFLPNTTNPKRTTAASKRAGKKTLIGPGQFATWPENAVDQLYGAIRNYTVPDGDGRLKLSDNDAAIGIYGREELQQKLEAYNQGYRFRGEGGGYLKADGTAGEGGQIDAAAQAAATSPGNDLPQPTEAQKEAGNYRKGHVSVQGLDLAIENPRGSERSGMRPDGSRWRHTMSDHYGYIKRTEGADGEQVDVYLGENADSEKVFVVDQLNQETGAFDEHKVMLGFNRRMQSVEAYKSNFDAGWKVGRVTELTMSEFKAWLRDGDLSVPAADAVQERVAKVMRAELEDVSQAEGVAAVRAYILGERTLDETRAINREVKGSDAESLSIKQKDLLRWANKQKPAAQAAASDAGARLTAAMPGATLRSGDTASSNPRNPLKGKWAVFKGDEMLSSGWANTQAEAVDAMLAATGDKQQRDGSVTNSQDAIDTLERQSKEAYTRYHNGSRDKNGMLRKLSRAESLQTERDRLEHARLDIEANRLRGILKPGNIQESNYELQKQRFEEQEQRYKQWLAEQDAADTSSGNTALERAIAAVEEGGARADGISLERNGGSTRVLFEGEAVASLDGRVTQGEILSALRRNQSNQAASQPVSTQPRDKIIAELDTVIAEQQAIADDWESRTYKRNNTQVDLQGDGPRSQGSISVSGANESRRENAILAANQAVRAARTLKSDMQQDYAGTMDSLVDMLSQVESDADFEVQLLADMGVRPPGGKGNVSSNPLSKAVLRAVKAEQAVAERNAQDAQVQSDRDTRNAREGAAANAQAVADGADPFEVLFGDDGVREGATYYSAPAKKTKLPAKRYEEADYRVMKRDLGNLTPDEQTALDAFLSTRDDAAQILANLEKHKGTPWASQAIEGMFTRQAMLLLMQGKVPNFQSALDKSDKIINALYLRGAEGAWSMVEGKGGLLGAASKPVNNVNSSFINCNPSKDCASFCYATKGHYRYASNVVKSELVTMLIELDPARAAARIAAQYKSTAEFAAQKALRLFDKGDGNAAWIPVIKALNAKGVRVQVFSKNPEFLRQMPDMNLGMLSVDDSNMQMARDNPDLPIAFVYSGPKQLADLKEISDRNKLQVVLPVKLGQKVLDAAKVEQIKREVPAAKPYLCPIDSGYQEIGGNDEADKWNCTKCDVNGGVGCFKGNPTAAILNSLEVKKATWRDVTALRALRRKINDAIGVDGEAGAAVAGAGGLRPGGNIELLGEVDLLLGDILAELDPGTARDSGRGSARGTGDESGRDDGGISGRLIPVRQIDAEATAQYSQADRGVSGERPAPGVSEVNERKPRKVSRVEPTDAETGQLSLLSDVLASSDLPAKQLEQSLRDTYHTTSKSRETDRVSVGVERITSAADAAHVVAKFRKHNQETMLVVAVDKDGKPLEVIRHSKGLRDQASVDHGTIAGALLDVPGVAGYWLAHNHPSGDSTPSGADHIVTDRVRDVLDSLLKYKGSIVLGSGTKAHSYFDRGSTMPITTTAAARKASVSVTERVLVKRGSEGRVVSPRTAIDAINRTEADQAIILLDTKHNVVGSLALDGKMLETLRSSEQAKRILRGLGNTNASAVIFKNNSGNGEVEGFKNLTRMLKAANIRVLDYMDRSSTDGGWWSDAEGSGKVIQAEGAYFRRTEAGLSPSSVVEAEQAPAEPLTVAQVQAAADAFLAEYNGNIELSARVRKTQEQQYGPKGSIAKIGVVKGAYHRDAGVFTLTADHLSDTADARETLRHEILGHYGLDTFAPADKDALLQAIIASRNEPSLKAAWDYVADVYDDKSLMIQAEEVFAHLAEGSRNGAEKLADMLRSLLTRLLRKVGFKKGMVTRTELLREIEMIAKGIRNGTRAPGGSYNYTPSAGSSNLRSGLPFGPVAKIDSSAFKNWFGKSVVVDKSGKPLVVYHGTSADLTEFSTKRDNGMVGAYFTKSQDLAKIYAGYGQGEQGGGKVGDGGAIYPVYLSIQNPLVVDGLELRGRDKTAYNLSKRLFPRVFDRLEYEADFETKGPGSSWIRERDLAKLKELGYDGIINEREGEIVVFEPGQIKSASGNIGTFDGSNPNILFQRAAAVTTAAFKRWFGSSKVVDKQGAPKMLYHGTGEDFTVFDQGRSGGSTRHSTAPLGIFMTGDRDTAQAYATKASDGIPGYARVMELYAAIRNPYLMTVAESQALASPGESAALRGKLEREGYDGINLKGTDTWIAFWNTQVKSAKDNNGDFDEWSGDILMRRSPKTSEGLRKLGLTAKETKGVLEHVQELVSADWRVKLRELGVRTQEGIFDGMLGVKRAEAAVGITDPDKSGYVSMRMASGLADVMHAVMLYGAPEWRDGIIQAKANTRGLLDVLGDLGNDNLNDWLGWLGGKRAELLTKQGRENNLDAAEIKALLALAKGREKQFEKVYREYAALNEAMLDVAQEAGLIDPASRATWLTDYYVPFYREQAEGEMFSGPRTKRGLSHQSAAIKQLRGGNVPTKDLLENLLTSWSQRIDASLKNKALVEIVENLDGSDFITNEDMKWQRLVVPRAEVVKKIEGDRVALEFWAEQMGLDETANHLEIAHELNKLDTKGYEELWGRVAPTDPEVIRVQRGGKNSYFRVNDASLLRGVKAMAGTQFNDPVTRIGRWFKGLLTMGVTSSPDFIARNFIRDAVQAWAINTDGFKLGVDSIKNLRLALKEDSDYQALMFSGGSFQGGYVMAGDPEAAAQMIRRALEKKGMTLSQRQAYMGSLLLSLPQLGGALKQGWQKYRELGDKVENANRLATYKAALAAGKSRRQSAYEAKDLMDFSLRGNFAAMQWFTDVVPFLNARLQGLYKLGRAMHDDKTILAKEVAVKGLYIALFSVFLAGMNDDEERYKELPEWDKDTNWHFFLGDLHFRIPKPFELGLLFGTIPERMFHVGGGSQDWGDFGSSMVRGITQTLEFNPVPQMVNPIREVQANRNMFFDTPIEGMADEGKLPEARYDSYTSLTARALGKATGPLLDLSPKQLQHLWQGYTGTMGGYVLWMADRLVSLSMSGTGEKAARDASDYPVLKGFYRGDRPRSTQYHTDLYDMLNEVEQIARTMKAYQAEGRIEEAAELFQGEGGKLQYRKMLGLARQQLGAIRKRVELIHRDTEMTSDQKRAALDELQIRSNTIVERVAKQAQAAFD